jgi:hypothetical protein
MRGLTFCGGALVAGLLSIANAAMAAPTPSPSPTPSGSATPRPAHPQINWFNRQEEDWSALADPALRTDPFDSLKYIPLGRDPEHYLSLGTTIRELPESLSFQIGNLTPQTYLLSRMMLDVDLHLGEEVRIFTQVASYFAPWKEPLTGVDQNPLALEQGFAQLHFPGKHGTLDVRIGRQQIAFDLQRFVSFRDGPNVLQPFDAVWADYQSGLWKVQGLYSQPVKTPIMPVSGYSSSNQLRFSGFHVEHGSAAGKVSAYVAQLYDANAFYLYAKGAERRNVYDLRNAGAVRGNDWDLEGMVQAGTVGGKQVRAWGAGTRYGYTWKTPRWSPRLGIQIDTASGDTDPTGNVLGTFNPLFPNGYYETLAGYPGYSNFWHLKPSLTLHPWRSASMFIAVADLWRQTTTDAVYTLPVIPVANTAGHGSAYSGNYQEIRIDWNMNPHLISALEFEHFINAAWLAQTGAHNGNFAGLEFEFGI